MRRVLTLIGAAALVVAAMPIAAAQEVEDDRFQLVRVGDEAGEITDSVAISGLEDGEVVVGLDQRPADGSFYALTDTGRILVVDTETGDTTEFNTLTEDLADPASVGADFNPVADAFRIISGTQNLRIGGPGEPFGEDDETFVDGDINYPAPAPPNNAATAYTNSELNDGEAPEGTVQYVIDVENQHLSRVFPPNDGILYPVAPLVDGDGDPIPVSETSDLDILGGVGFLYADDALHTVDLTTGAIETIAGTDGDFAGVTVEQDGPLLPLGDTFIGVTADGDVRRISDDGSTEDLGTLDGLGADEVVGLDQRPATGDLVVLTTDGRLLAFEAPETPIGGGDIDTTELADLDLDLPVDGTGIDFNPAADALRVVSGDGNVRIPFGGDAPFTLNVDVDFAYAPLDAIDVVATGYTGSEVSEQPADATTQYAIDVASSTYSRVAPPNDGVLRPVGPLTIDGEAVELGADTHLDIASGAHWVFALGALHTIDPATGAITTVGEVTGFDGTVTGFSVDQTDGGFLLVVDTDDVEEPPADAEGDLIVVVTDAGRVLSYPVEDPSAATEVAFPDLEAIGVVAADYRVTDGLLYAVTASSELVKIRVETGAITTVGTVDAPTPSTVDFNPVVDLLRWETADGQNFRIDPDTAAVVEQDTSLNYAEGDANEGAAPRVVGTAYSDNFGNTDVTSQFVVDGDTGVLAAQDPPNDGVLSTIGDLGVAVGIAGFDISQAESAAYLAGDVDGTQSVARVSLEDGTVDVVGEIGGLLPGETVASASVLPRSVRLFGETRFETSAQVSRATFPDGADVAYLAVGTRFPDSLTSGALAGAVDGPVLLTDTDVLAPVAAAELERLGVSEIVVAGGESAISAEVAAAASQIAPVRRIGGAERMETAAQLALDAYPDGADRVYVATGLEFPDALAGSAAGAFEGAPVLLTLPDQLNVFAAEALEQLDPDEVILLGGFDAVTTQVEEELTQFGDVTRLRGENRFATAAAVSEAIFGDDADRAFIATGADFPDALTGGPAAAQVGAPILLSFDPIEFATGTTEELDRLDVDQITVLGGRLAVAFETELTLLGFTRR